MRNIIFTISLFLISFISFSQTNLEVISTAGDYYVGTNVSLSWTIGEPVIETVSAGTVTLTQGFQQPNVTTLGGYLTYDNSKSSPMTNTWVYLYNSGLEKIDSSETNTSGYYAMSDIPNGAYTLKFKTIKAWGGANPVDALEVNRNYIHLLTFKDNIMKIAADVSNDGKINPVDALMINRRYIKILSSFPSGDWAFENPTITMNGGNVTQDVKSLCYGDVAGKDTPSGARIMNSDVQLLNQGILLVEKNKEFELPISVTKDLNLGACGLVISYPTQSIKVSKVSSNLSGLEYNILDGEIRVAWSDAGNEGVDFKTNDPVIKLIMSVFNADNLNEIQVNVAPETILSDTQLNIYAGDILTAPRIAVQEASNLGYYLSQNYPNPAKNTTRIDYRLPEDANVVMKVYDLLGKEVAELVNGSQTTGYHQVNFNITGLAGGVYLYKFEAKGPAGEFNKTKMMVISQ